MATERWWLRWLAVVPAVAALATAPATAHAQDSTSRFGADSIVIPAERDTNFAVVGGAVGSPGYINAVVGYFWPHVAVQLSGGYWSQGRSGIEGAVIWRTLHHPGFSVGPALAVGTFGTLIDSTDAAGGSLRRRQVYVGPALNVYLDGFHLQAGVAYGFRDYPHNPQLVIQTGYLFRLR